MKLLKHSILIAFATTLFLCAITGAAARAANSEGIPDSKNKIIKLRDGGVEPNLLRMRVEDSIVFFLNETSDSLATLEVEFGDKMTHCASSNMVIDKAGEVHSVRPFGPNDFSSTCFHEKGTYPFTIYGLKSNPKGVHGQVIIE